MNPNPEPYIEVSGQQFKSLPLGLKIPNNNLNIFVGANNSGKSNILEYVRGHFPEESYYISTQRFNVTNRVPVLENVANAFSQSRDSRVRKDGDNSEIPGPDPTQELAALDKDSSRLLFKWHSQYFAKIKIASNPNFPYQAKQILIDGHRPSDQGSGSRAVFALLVKLFDPRIKIVCIDEPELSVEPRTQKKLFELIKGISVGANGLPQKKIFISTHSHLFIDKSGDSVNHRVTKVDGFTQINPIGEHDLIEVVFDLLGNSPGDLFFPSNIIIVEGESDYIFLSKIISLFPDSPKRRGLRIHYSDGDNKITSAVKSIDQMLKTVPYSPIYKDKMCILFDKQSNRTFIKESREFLNDRSGVRVKELPENGIEYFYPKKILSKITKLSVADLPTNVDRFSSQANSSRDGVGTLGRFKGTKVELAKKVASDTFALQDVDGLFTVLIRKALSLAFP